MSSGEEYPPDYDDLPMAYDYVIERNGGMRIMYTSTGRTAHIISTTGLALCGMDTWLDWFGTGDMEEIEKAHSLPLCKHCTRNVNPMLLRREERPR